MLFKKPRKLKKTAYKPSGFVDLRLIRTIILCENNIGVAGTLL